MIPVYIISLERCLERREKMAWLMEHYKIPYTFFDAVDSTRLTKQDLDLADLALAEEYCGHKLSLAEVACALSHIKLYEKQVNEKIERMIILEDDAHIHMNFKGIVDSVSSMSSYDLIYLYHDEAKKLLQIAYPIRMPADYLLGRLQLNNLNAYGVEPSCIDVDLVKTTIEDRAYGHYLETNDSSKN